MSQENTPKGWEADIIDHWSIDGKPPVPPHLRPAGSPIPKPRRKRKSKLAREQEARDMLADLSTGMDLREVCQRHELSERTYYRRLKDAGKAARDEYSQVHTVCLKHQSYWRHLQEAAARQADDVLMRIEKTPRDTEHAQQRVALMDMFLRLLKFMGECDKQMFAMARQTGTMPPPGDVKKMEAMQLAFVRIMKESALDGKNVVGGEGFLACGGPAGGAEMLPQEDPKILTDGKATTNKNGDRHNPP